MGIKGLWEQITVPEAVSPAAIGEEHMEKHQRPLRVAVDVYSRIYRDKAMTDPIRGGGGMNHLAKNVFYFATHFLEAGVQPIFVFDGPEKPTYKRGAVHSYSTLPHNCPLQVATASSTRTKEDMDRDQSILHATELARKVFDALGLPCIDAIGEGEAECCALEKAGLVDTVATTDGDAFVFGSKMILRPLPKEGTAIRKAEIYEQGQVTTCTKPARTLTRGYCLLLALVNGGDYGNGLYQEGNQAAIQLYTEYGARLDGILASENQSFILAPGTRSKEELRSIVNEDTWQRLLNVKGFRDFSAEYFDWKGRGYARKFGNILCPPYLTTCLMIQGQRSHEPVPDLQRAKLEIAKKRNVKTPTGLLKVSYLPESLLDMSLSAEPDIPGYKRDFKFTTTERQSCPVPEWPIEFGLPDLYNQWCDEALNKSRSRPARKRRRSSVAGLDTDEVPRKRSLSAKTLTTTSTDAPPPVPFRPRKTDAMYVPDLDFSDDESDHLEKVDVADDGGRTHESAIDQDRSWSAPEEVVDLTSSP